MNTKELSNGLDEILTSVAGVAQEHGAKVDKAEKLLRELNDVSQIQIGAASLRGRAEYVVSGSQSDGGPVWRSQARIRANAIFEQWLLDNGLLLTSY